MTTAPYDRPNRALIGTLIGCGALAFATLIAIAVYAVLYAADPCACEGDPDAEWSHAMAPVPWALLAFVVTLLFVTLVAAVTIQVRGRRRTQH